MADGVDSRPDGGSDFYRQLLQHAAVAMVATDADYSIVAWNDAASELLGQDGQAMIGKSLYQAVPPDRENLLRRLLQRTAKRGVASQLDVRLPDRTGQMRDLLVILSPIPGPQGIAQGVAAWIIDETHRKQLSDRLAQAEKIASLGTLAGGVAHHFNNILGGVATFVDYALTSGDPVAMKRALQMTAEAASRAAKITQSLLSFAKRDPHQADLADLTEVVLTFTHLVERPLANRNIKLNLDLKAVPIIPVEANRMHQVLGNLLTNAEEAMPEGGTVSISLDRTGGQVRLAFADTGCGIKKEHLPLVFEPFFTTKGLLAGGDRANPGLGLSVAHGIVVEMGGNITVESRIGKGTKFTISFSIPSQDDA
jgi:PAS domain S-box-containing protein